MGVEIFVSCFDFKITGSSSPSPAPVPPTQAPAPPTQAPCTDENQNCGSWAASGQCEANPAYMLVNCRLSCGVCSPPTQAPAPPTQAPCTDENQNCGNWAASGQCQANPDYMLVNSFELWCLLSRCADAGSRARIAQEHEEACVISVASAAMPCNN